MRGMIWSSRGILNRYLFLAWCHVQYNAIFPALFRESTCYMLGMKTLKGTDLRKWKKKAGSFHTFSTSLIDIPLQLRHNGYSNHRRLDCLLNRLFSRRSKFRTTGPCEGNQPVTSVFSSQRPVTWKMFPFDDVIMHTLQMRCHCWYLQNQTK